MKGTEKQIKWAEDIKAKFEARVIKVYASVSKICAVRMP